MAIDRRSFVLLSGAAASGGLTSVVGAAGVPFPVRISTQGLIFDASGHVAVTNGVVIEVAFF